MNVEKAIELGRQKVRVSYVSNQINDLDDKVFEILGYTEADYFGTEEIDSFKRKFDTDNDIFDTDNDIYEMEFYQYNDKELVECSFGKAISTSEYDEHDIFIISEKEDEKRKYYVTSIINKN